MKIMQNYFFTMYAIFGVCFFIVVFTSPFIKIAQPTATTFWLSIIGAFAVICFLLHKVDKLEKKPKRRNK